MNKERLLNEGVAGRLRIKYYFNKIDEFYEKQSDISLFIKENLESESELIEVGLREAINNSFEHGGGDVEVEISIESKKRIWISIYDSGNGEEYSLKINKLREVNIKKYFEKISLKEGGRGIPLMISIFDEVFYDEGGDGLVLFKDVEEEKYEKKQ